MTAARPGPSDPPPVRAATAESRPETGHVPPTGRRPRLNTGGLLYGTIVSAAALALGANQGDTAARMIDAMSATLLIYWLAHVYTETVSGRVPGGTVSLFNQVKAAAWHESSILMGGLPALVMIVSLTLADVTLWVDVLAAIGVSAVMLVLGGFVVGRRAGFSGWKLAGESTSAALFGGLLALLLVWLHTH